jgi:ankyrin repeat protein
MTRRMAMSGNELRLLIERGDVQGMQRALAANRALANQTILWVHNQANESDPLHYVSDCVYQGWLTNGKEGEIASVLLAHGAAIEGRKDRESPLIAAASLGAEKVARVLLEAGAALERTSVFGARALHWAAWMGLSSTVEQLLNRGAQLEPRCSEFGATPLFWAVHGYGPNGPKHKHDQVGAARLLIAAGARVDTANENGLTARDLAAQCAQPDMADLLR